MFMRRAARRVRRMAGPRGRRAADRQGPQAADQMVRHRQSTAATMIAAAIRIPVMAMTLRTTAAAVNVF